MRITNSMMVKNFMADLNKNMTKVDKYQYQLSTGRRIRYLSDDPIGIMASLSARSKLSKLDMHNASIGDAKSWLTQTETALEQINSVITKLYESAVAAANGTMNGDDKLVAAEEVKQLRDHVVQLGNSTYGGRYIFGGYNTTTAPFTYDAFGTLLYNGVDLVTAAPAVTGALQAQVIRYSTGVSITTDVAINGVDLMGTGANNMDAVIGDFQTALETNAPSATLSAIVGTLQNKQKDILSLLADVGGRLSRLDLMSASNSEDGQNYTEVLSNVEDADQAQATMDFKMAETVYRSALAVGAQVIQPTRLDFLK
jgi:flagellar hook-associated protein 3 FlgL